MADERVGPVGYQPVRLLDIDLEIKELAKCCEAPQADRSHRDAQAGADDHLRRGSRDRLPECVVGWACSAYAKFISRKGAKDVHETDGANEDLR